MPLLPPKPMLPPKPVMPPRLEVVVCPETPARPLVVVAAPEGLLAVLDEPAGNAPAGITPGVAFGCVETGTDRSVRDPVREPSALTEITRKSSPVMGSLYFCRTNRKPSRATRSSIVDGYTPYLR
jgi:hypothetical protein